MQTHRGGHGANVLAVLAQFRATATIGYGYGVQAGAMTAAAAAAGMGAGSGTRSVGDVQFCGPIAGSEEGAMLVRELETQGVGTAFSVVREGKGVPAAWVIESGAHILLFYERSRLTMGISTANATKTVM